MYITFYRTFCVNKNSVAEPDQGFNDKQFKITYFFLQKMSSISCWASIENGQAPGEAYSP